MDESIACPTCGAPVRGRPLNSWRYYIYSVRRYQCPRCGKKYNVYNSPKLTYTIPRSK